MHVPFNVWQVKIVEMVSNFEEKSLKYVVHQTLSLLFRFSK